MKCFLKLLCLGIVSSVCIILVISLVKAGFIFIGVLLGFFSLVAFMRIGEHIENEYREDRWQEVKKKYKIGNTSKE